MTTDRKPLGVQEELFLPAPIPKPVLPAPTDSEQIAIAEAKRRTRARRRHPQMVGHPAPFGKEQLIPTHADKEGFQAQLRDAFGTTSGSFVNAQFSRICRILGNTDGKADIDAINAALAIVSGIRPENELEAALAVQIALAHQLSTDMLLRMRQAGRPDHMERYANLATKLQRTMGAHIETLVKLRRPTDSTIGQVTVKDGGQAIVGSVTVNKGKGGKTDG